MKFRCNLTIALTLVFCSHAYAQESDSSVADSNEDGKVTVAEFESYADGKLPEFEMLKEFAKQVDADGNGEISEEEFSNRMNVLRSLTSPAEKDKAGEMPKKQKKEKPAKDNAAKKTFEKMSKLMADKKLSEAAEFMTKQAQDDFATMQLVSSIAMLDMEMPMPMPKFEDTVDRIDDVLIKYDLNELEIDPSKMFRVEMSVDGMVEEEEEDEKEEMGESDGDNERKADDKTETADKPDRDKTKSKEADDTGAMALKALDKDGKRWEIIGELLEAKSVSPFGMNPLTGKVTKFELHDENTAFLELSAAEHDNDEGNGVVIQLVTPPTVVRMTKSNNEWKYDGRDEKRSRKAMKEFMLEQQERFGSGGRTDF